MTVTSTNMIDVARKALSIARGGLPHGIAQLRARAQHTRGDLAIVTTPITHRLAHDITNLLGLRAPHKIRFGRQDCGLWGTEGLAPLNGKSVFLFHTVGHERLNDDLLQLETAIVDLADAGVREINLFMLLMPYARQDRRAKIHQPLSAREVLRMIAQSRSTLGLDIEDVGGGRGVVHVRQGKRVVKQIVVVDIHNPALESALPTNCRFWNLTGRRMLLPELLRLIGEDNLHLLKVGGPDFGSLKAVKMLLHDIFPLADDDLLEKHLIQVDKTRGDEGVTAQVLCNVAGRVCLLFDDMIDTAKTIVTAAELLRQQGATRVLVAAAHPIFSGQAVQRLSTAVRDHVIDQVLVLNTMPLPEPLRFPGLRIVDMSPYMAEVVAAVYLDADLGKYLNVG
ncbi:MAG: ribose-phosphate pyrophosphokinase-like domain-containing protein [Candidatus Margulisiibacteriota bacterium]